MKRAILAMSCAIALSAVPLAAQTGTGSGSGTGSGDRGREEQKAPTTVQTPKAAVATKVEEVQPNPRFVRTLTNVQIELTLTDQAGSAAPDKKAVSMIAASGNWGKIRSVGTVFPVGEPPYAVELNVDARPFVSVEGQIQLEVTLNYVPTKGAGDPKEGRQRSSGINQSQTVVLQSGKPLVISQAADPISDRKVLVEVRATVIK